MKKLFKGLLYLSIIGLSIVGGALIQKNFLNIEAKESQSSIIAVVNTDNGFTKNGETISYANDLLVNQSGLKFTGISDASEGVKNGTYAAYVVIPENFSESVESINSTPITAVLNYEVSGDLSKVAKEQTMTQIYQLQDQINYQTGYMYLSSVVNEFHQGQDISKNIISKEEEVIQTVNSLHPSNLTVIMETTELPDLMVSTAELNIDEDKKSIENTTSQIESDYLSAGAAVRDDFAEVNNEYVSLKESMKKQDENSGTMVDDLIQTSIGAVNRQYNEVMTTLIEIDHQQVLHFEEANTNLNQSMLVLNNDVDGIVKDTMDSTYKKGYLSAIEGNSEGIYNNAYKKGYISSYNSDYKDIYTSGYVEGYNQSTEENRVAWSDDVNKISYKKGHEQGYILGQSSAINRAMSDVDQQVEDRFILVKSESSTLSDEDFKSIVDDFKSTKNFNTLLSFINSGDVVIEQAESLRGLVASDIQTLPVAYPGLDDSEIKPLEDFEYPLAINKVKGDIDQSSISVQPYDETLIDKTIPKYELGDLDLSDVKPSDEDIMNTLGQIKLKFSEMFNWLHTNGNNMNGFNDLKDNRGLSLAEVIDTQRESVLNEIETIDTTISPIDTVIMDNRIDSFLGMDHFDDADKKLDKNMVSIDQSLGTIIQKKNQYEKEVELNSSNNYDAVSTYSSEVNKNASEYKVRQDESIINGVTTVQNNTEVLLGNNVSSLKGFVTKLPYTRSGESQNKAVKDHILRGSTSTIQFREMLPKQESFSLFAPTIAISVLLIASGVGSLVLKKRKIEE